MGRTENLSTFLDLNCPCADSRRDTGEEKEASEKKESGKYDDRRTSGWSLSWPACLVIIARGRRAGDRRQYELPNPTVLCPRTGVYSHTWPWLLSNLTWAAALKIGKVNLVGSKMGQAGKARKKTKEATVSSLRESLFSQVPPFISSIPVLVGKQDWYVHSKQNRLIY